MKGSILNLTLAFISLFIFTSCYHENKTVTQSYYKMLADTTDYSDINNWAIFDEGNTYDIDLFFVHPTTYGPPANGQLNAFLDDTALNIKTDSTVIIPMTNAFINNCNVFAPRYRQMNIEVLSMSTADQEKYIQIPILDITTALNYYFENLNDGRPFILASHSQGSNVLQSILLNYPGSIPFQKLVAAYMPGYTFTQEQLDQIGLPLSQSQDDTGCVITWNTIGTNGTSPVLMDGALCVNPLSWTTDTNNYPAEFNLGAKIVMPDYSTIDIDHYTSAKINDYGGLEIPIPSNYDTLNMNMGPDCYHRYDYDFFIKNIKENIGLRCAKYLKNYK